MPLTDPALQLFSSRSHFRPLNVNGEGIACGALGGRLAGEAHRARSLLLRLRADILGPDDWAIFLEPDFRASVEPVAPSVPHEGGDELRLGTPERDESWLAFDPTQGCLKSKLGGRPGYIQHELSQANREIVERDTMEFVFQFVADSLPRKSPLGPVLCDGAVYVFAPRCNDLFEQRNALAVWQL